MVAEETVARTQVLVDATTKPAERSLKRFEKKAESQGTDAGEAYGDGFGKGVSNKAPSIEKSVEGVHVRMEKQATVSGNKAGKKFGDGFWKSARDAMKKNPLDGLDDDVKLVLGLITASAPGIAGLLSAIGAGLTGLIASLGGAVAGFASLYAVMPQLAYGLSLATAGLGRIKELAPQAASSLDNLKRVFNDVDVPAFMAEWEASLSRFLDTLAGILEFDQLAAKTGAAFATITDAFTDVLNSPAVTAFREAMESTLPDALASLGTGAASGLEALAAVFAAAAPVVKTMADNFAAFMAEVAESATAAQQSGALTDFFVAASESLDILLFTIGEVIGLIKAIGPEAQAFGDTFLATVGSLIGVWADWLETIEGQTALQEWFDNANIILGELLELIIVLGQTLGGLITPESTVMLATFIQSITNFLPILGQILGLVTNLQVLNIIAALFDSIRIALEPLMPVLGDFATELGTALMQIVPALTPLLAALVSVVASLLPALTPLLPPLVSLITNLTDALVPVVEALTPIIVILAEALGSTLEGAVVILNPIIEILGVFLEAVAKILTAILIPAIGAAITIFNAIIAAIRPLINSVMPRLREWFQKGSDALDSLVAIVKLGREAFDMLADDLSDNVAGAFDAVGDAIDGVIDWFNSLDDTVSTIVSNIIGWIGRINWPTPPAWVTNLFGGGGSTPAFATGGVVTGPTKALIGEAGPEMVVPLARPLSMVDPAVRDVAAYAQGKTPAMAGGGIAGGGVTISPGAITVVSPYSNPRLVAEDVMDQLVLAGK